MRMRPLNPRVIPHALSIPAPAKPPRDLLSLCPCACARYTPLSMRMRTLIPRVIPYALSNPAPERPHVICHPSAHAQSARSPSLRPLSPRAICYPSAHAHALCGAGYSAPCLLGLPCARYARA